MTNIGGIEVLSKSIREQITKYFAVNEKVLYCLQSDIYDQALVALEHRLIRCRLYGGIIEKIFSTTTFDIESVEYVDVTSIDVTNNPLKININNGGYFWMDKKAETELIRFSEWLRNKVRQERKEITITQDSSQPAASISSELEKLASLHQNGVLSQQEFEAAKRKLLGL